MKLRFKTLIASLVLCFLASGMTWLWANPYEEITADQRLYQRVKKLGDYGLLDAQDKAVLDQGKIVTRLELAFYTEKAKARISAPQRALSSSTPSASLPPVMDSSALPVAAPPSAPALPEPFAPAPPVPAAPALPEPAAPAPVVNSGVKSEIEDLLKQLHEETAYLRTRLSLNDERIRQQEDELEKLKTVQDEVDAVWKKANKSIGMPHFFTNTNFRFENINVTGPLSGGTPLLNNALRIVQEFQIGMYTDLEGKGVLSTGFGVLVPYTNFSGVYASGVGISPSVLTINNPSATFYLYGDLGKWDATFAVETYQPDTSLGDFSRGFATYAIKRFEDPFDIKQFNDDKNAKNWDDFISSVSYIPAYSATAGNVQSATDRVFDGLYLVGHQLPWMGPDGRMTVMMGRMGTSPTQTQRLEEAL
ncbi:MAG TPA: hypothetical protein VIJ93_12575, partial [bacterium]